MVIYKCDKCGKSVNKDDLKSTPLADFMADLCPSCRKRLYAMIESAQNKFFYSEEENNDRL
jgi:DNA-directed RNA polymerase subunit RPC12/RpoP|nr:hypothetical protein [uncultured Lachnoclostridium sp.]